MRALKIMEPSRAAPVIGRAALLAAALLAAAPPEAARGQDADPEAPQALDLEALFDITREPALLAEDDTVKLAYYPADAVSRHPALLIELMSVAVEDAVIANRQAEASRLEAEENGLPYWRRHEYAIYDSSPFEGARLVSVVRGRFIDSGGAHPVTDYASWVWDREERRAVALTELFEGGAIPESFRASWAAAVSALKEERLGPGGAAGWETWFADGGRTLEETPFSLEPSTEAGYAGGLRLHHGPYDVGAYAEGAYEPVVPLADFEAALAAPYAESFAGAPRR